VKFKRFYAVNVAFLADVWISLVNVPEYRNLNFCLCSYANDLP